MRLLDSILLLIGQCGRPMADTSAAPGTVAASTAINDIQSTSLLADMQPAPGRNSRAVLGPKTKTTNSRLLCHYQHGCYGY